MQRQAGRERDRNDDDWSQNPDLNSEDDPSEIVCLKFSPYCLNCLCVVLFCCCCCCCGGRPLYYYDAVCELKRGEAVINISFLVPFRCHGFCLLPPSVTIRLAHRVENMDMPSLRRHCRINEVSYSRLSRKMHKSNSHVLFTGYRLFPSVIDRSPLQRKCISNEVQVANKLLASHSLCRSNCLATRIAIFNFLSSLLINCDAC